MTHIWRVLALLACVAVAVPAAAGSKEKKEKKDVTTERRHDKKEQKSYHAEDKKEHRSYYSDEKKEHRDYYSGEKKAEYAHEEKEYRAGFWRHPHEHFSEDHYRVYHDYYLDEYGYGECAPGLVLRYGRCFWPGYSTKRYILGHVLPLGIPILLPPPALLKMLAPPLPGHVFVIVDGDLVEMVKGTRRIVDALDPFD